MDFERLARERYERATPEERVRIDEARRLRAEDAARPRARVKAIRKDCFTGEEREVEIVLVARPGHGEQIWVHVEEGGPTGYESIPLARLPEAIAAGKAWAACFGTEGRWDGLTVPVSSLRIALEVFGGAS